MLSAVEPFSTWVLWEGEERSMDCWYINLQEPFRRTRDGIDSQDLELDFVVAPDGADAELFSGQYEGSAFRGRGVGSSWIRYARSMAARLACSGSRGVSASP
jgi:Protein of unknown function (DUF402)